MEMGEAPVLALDGSEKRRLKIWDLPAKWHCTLVGTCLTLAELRKLAAKARVLGAETMSDYQLHCAFVAAAGQPQHLVAKLVNKLLDRKYAVQLARFAKASSDRELEALWDAALKGGDVPGAAWALATHALPSPFLRDRVFGDIHMLSHLSGASHRADLRRLSDLERRAGETAQEMASLRRRVRESAEHIGGLQRELAAAAAVRARAEALETRLAELESGEAVAELKSALSQAVAEREKALRRAEAAERRLSERDTVIDHLTEENLRLGREIEEMRRLAATSPVDAGCEAEEDPPPDLGGRCILYVGGAHRMVPHLEAAVARCNGELLYHDGGLEEGCGRLAGALSRADFILCPVTCVSHDAVDHIKRTCRKCAKPFVPLRSAGLGAFMRGLQLLSQPQPERPILVDH